MFQDRIVGDERHVALIDDRDGLVFLFVDSQQLGQAEPAVPHWVKRAPDERTLHVLTRWFAVRRHHWQEWGELSNRIGYVAFGQFIEELMAQHPPQEVTGDLLQVTDTPDEIVIGEAFADGTSEILYRHRFGSPDARNRFIDWFHEGENFRQAQALVHCGYSEGSIALGRTLDNLVSADVDVGRGGPAIGESLAA